MNLPRAVAVFEREMLRRKPWFVELRDFPKKTVDSPDEVVWELNELMDYPLGKYAAAGSQKGPGRIIFRIEHPGPYASQRPAVGNAGEPYLFFHIDTANPALRRSAEDAARAALESGIPRLR